MSFIQWYPGHMHLTRQLIEERIKAIDVVIEVLDARIPGSSFNPLLQTLTGHKPRVKLLNKQDVADPVQTQAWLQWYNAQADTRAIAMDASDPAHAGFNLRCPQRRQIHPDQHHDGEKTSQSR